MSGADLPCPAAYDAPLATDGMADRIDEELGEILETEPAFRSRLDRLSQPIGQGEVTRHE